MGKDVSTPRPATWTEADSQAAGAAQASHAAEGDNRHYVTHIAASFSSTEAGALLTLTDGATVIMRWYVYDSIVIDFASPVAGSRGNAVVADLAAGTGTGVVSMAGFSQ